MQSLCLRKQAFLEFHFLEFHFQACFHFFTEKHPEKVTAKTNRKKTRETGESYYCS